MSTKIGLTKVAAEENLPEAYLRTMAIDAKTISGGLTTPKPEVVTPKAIEMRPDEEEESAAGPRRRGSKKRLVVLLVVFIVLAVLAYYFVYPKLMSALDFTKPIY